MLFTAPALLPFARAWIAWVHVSILYVYYMYYVCKKLKSTEFCWVFLGFLRPQRFLPKSSRFSCVFLGFLASAVFVCLKVQGFSDLFIDFSVPAAIFA